MLGIHLKDDWYMHNEAHTRVVDVHATCKWRVTFYHPQRCKMPKHRRNIVRLALATPLSYTSLAERSPQAPHKQG